jgi:hypothetical protein
MKGRMILAGPLCMGLCGCWGPPESEARLQMFGAEDHAVLVRIAAVAKRCGAAEVRLKRESLAIDLATGASRACFGAWREKEWERRHPVLSRLVGVFQ